MPQYYFECSCGRKSRRILRREVDVGLCECGLTPKRAPRAATIRVTETLDNGIMSRRVERLADAERLYQERAKLTGDKL